MWGDWAGGWVLGHAQSGTATAQLLRQPSFDLVGTLPHCHTRPLFATPLPHTHAGTWVWECAAHYGTTPTCPLPCPIAPTQGPGCVCAAAAERDGQ